MCYVETSKATLNLSRLSPQSKDSRSRALGLCAMARLNLMQAPCIWEELVWCYGHPASLPGSPKLGQRVYRVVQVFNPRAPLGEAPAASPSTRPTFAQCE